MVSSHESVPGSDYRDRKWEIIHLCRDIMLFIIKNQSVASSKCCFIFTYYKTDIICATFVYFSTKISALFFSLLYSICLYFIHPLTRSLLYSIFLVVSVCCYTVGRGTKKKEKPHSCKWKYYDNTIHYPGMRKRYLEVCHISRDLVSSLYM